MWRSIVNSWGAGLIRMTLNSSTITGSNPGAFNVNEQHRNPRARVRRRWRSTRWCSAARCGPTTAPAAATRGDGLINGTEAGVTGVLVSLFVDDGDGVFDAGDTFVTSVTTAAGGVYTFTRLGPRASYIVRVDQDNFDAGGNTSLLGLQGSSETAPEPIDPDDNVDNDDNGSRSPGQPAYSNAITLAYNTEPTADGTGQLDISTTPRLRLPRAEPGADLDQPQRRRGDLDRRRRRGWRSTSPATRRFADVDSANFDGGSLTVEITAGEVAAEDLLEIAAVGEVTFDATTVSIGGVQIATWTGAAPPARRWCSASTPTPPRPRSKRSPARCASRQHRRRGPDRRRPYADLDSGRRRRHPRGGGADTATRDHRRSTSTRSTMSRPAPTRRSSMNEDDTHAFSLSDFNFSDTRRRQPARGGHHHAADRRLAVPEWCADLRREHGGQRGGYRRRAAGLRERHQRERHRLRSASPSRCATTAGPTTAARTPTSPRTR